MTKYFARKITIDGITFDSEIEGARYLDVKNKSGLKVHPRILLQEGFTDGDGKRQRPIYYLPDFEYIEDGIQIFEDVKGFLTKDYVIKKKLFLYKIKDDKTVKFKEICTNKRKPVGMSISNPFRSWNSRSY